MRWLVVSGHVADIAIALALVEWAAVAWYHRRTAQGLSGADVAGNLLAGIVLLLALRGALRGAGWPWITACLTAALTAHVADVRRRWRPSATTPTSSWSGLTRPSDPATQHRVEGPGGRVKPDHDSV